MLHQPEDYDGLLDLMAESSVRTPMRILAYRLMPHHFHLALWPRGDGDECRWVHWLMTTHVRSHLGGYRSSGHVWQGRFKAFPIQEDEHLLAVLRYIERNSLRAGLVGQAEDWPWSRLRWLAAPTGAPVRLEPVAVPRGTVWVDGVDAVTSDIDLQILRESMRRDRPFGAAEWTVETAKAVNLEWSLNARGRPTPIKTPTDDKFAWVRQMSIAIGEVPFSAPGI